MLIYIMESFQVDIILSSLKELQEEKGRNECILAEEYGKRRELEVQLEEATSKHKVASEKNAKMKEAMKVAEMKVAQTQAQVKMMEQVNNERRERIRQLNQQIEQLEQQKQGQLSSFESQMSILTEKFRTAWHDFGDKTLNAAVEDCDRQNETLSTKLATSQTYLSKLTSQLDHLQTKEHEEQQEAEGIPTATWQMVIAMFEAEKEASKAALEKRKQSLEVEKLKEQQTRLAKQLEELETCVAKGTPHHEE